MLELFKIAGRIDLDGADEASKSLDNVDKKAEGLGSKLGKTAKGIGKGAMVIGAAVGSAAVAVGGMAVKSAGAADRIDKMSQRLGMSRGAFQEWDFILSQSGVSIDSMQMGMKSLSQRMNESAKGTGKGADLFKKLGVSVHDSSGEIRAQEDVFNDSIVSLQGMEEGIEKAALAQELFGRNGQELLPLLNASRGSVDELRQRAQELGIVMGDDVIDAGVVFTDSLDQVKRSLDTMGTVIGARVMPIVQQFLDWVIANMPLINKVMDVVFGSLADVVSVAVSWIQTLISWLSEWRTNNEETMMGIWQTIKTVFDQVVNFLQEAWANIKAFWEENGEAILEMAKHHFNNIKETVEVAFNGIWNIIKKIIDLVVPFLQEKLAQIQQFWEENGEQIMKAVDNAFKIIQGIIAFVMPVIQKIIEVAWGFITTIIDTAVNVIMGIIKVFSSLLTGDFEGIREAIMGIWESLWDGIKGIVDGAWGLLSGAFSALWDSISGWFIGLKDDAIDWGKNMIDGFIDGMKSKFGAIGSAAKGAIDSAAGFLKFWSPAKKGEGRYIRHWGRNMIDGFLDGVKDEESEAGQAMENVVKRMNPGSLDFNANVGGRGVTQSRVVSSPTASQSSSVIDYDLMGQAIARYMKFDFNIEGNKIASAVNQSNAVDSIGRRYFD